MEPDIKVVNFALGAGGRRFESFCPDKMKIRELQAIVTPFFFAHFQKQDTKRTRFFEKAPIVFLYFFVTPLPKRTHCSLSIKVTLWPTYHLYVIIFPKFSKLVKIQNLER